MMLETLFRVLLSSSWWILAIILIISVIYLYGTRNFDYWTKRGITGPPAYPFIGNFFSLTTPIPYLNVGYLKKYGKIFGAFRSQRQMLFIADPKVIKRIMAEDFQHFRNRLTTTSKGLSALLLVNTRDDRWKRIRSILTPMFTGSKLKRMEPQMRESTEAMIGQFEQKYEISAFDSMGTFIMDLIAKCAFSVQDSSEIFLLAKGLSFNAVRFLLNSYLPKSLYGFFQKHKFPVFYTPTVEYFVNLAKHLVAERRGVGSKLNHGDMLQAMINVEGIENSQEMNSENFQEFCNKESETDQILSFTGSRILSEDEIIAQTLSFFMDGYETTAATLAFCLFELAINESIQDQLFREILVAKLNDPELSYQTVSGLEYLDAVLSETLRKYPPVVITGRECNADEYPIPEVNYTLKKGEAVQLPIYAIHHCEEYYPEPERFIPERFLPQNRDQIQPFSYLPFGAGPRNCVGMRFALMGAKLGLAQLVNRFEFHKSKKTPNQLKIQLCFPLLKTEPIYLKVKKR